MKKILAATLPVKRPKVQFLCGDMADELVICVTFSEAFQALQRLPLPDLILCNIHFDDGRMYDFLQHVKGDPATGGIPFICVDDSQEVLFPSIRQSIDIAIRSLGAVQCINLAELQKTLGEDGLKAQFQKIVQGASVLESL